MNRQPFETPPRRWEPRLSPWLVRLCRPLRNRELYARQRIRRIDVQGLDHLRGLLGRGAGVLVTPNHSFHYDSYVLIEAAHRLGRPFQFLTAWQVFAQGSAWERWWLQRHGCFSVDREANDLQAFRTAVDVLRGGRHPLVVFPEGEIYHTNDRVTPFRDGAAAIALAAARRADRPVAAVPCALKAWYVRDPTPELLRLMDRLEQRLLWRPRPDLPLALRLYRLAEGLLALKELEYLGQTRSGTVSDRRQYLAAALLDRQESYYGLANSGLSVPERVRELRRTLIGRLAKPGLDPNDRVHARSDLEDLFFVVQLFSYPSNYVSARLSVERLAETFDKLEEDLLRVPQPAGRGTRRVVVRFGEPLPVPAGRPARNAAEHLTGALQDRVQGLLDGLNAEGPTGR